MPETQPKTAKELFAAEKARVAAEQAAKEEAAAKKKADQEPA